MQLKFFYTLSFLLCLVTFASSNECARLNCPATGKYKAACRASRENPTPACRKGQTMTGSNEVDNDESGMATPLMRLLYI